MSAIDIALIVLMVVAAVSGYRQGLIAGSLGFVGFLAGGALGMLLAPVVVAAWTNTLAQALATVLAVLVFAGVGQALLSLAGTAVRDAVEWSPIRVADAAGGAVLSIVAMLVLSWFLALAFVAGPSSTLATQLRGSSILTGVDGVMPQQARGLFTSLRNTFDSSVFPRVFAGIATPELIPVPPPNGDLAESAVARDVRDSVVEVLGSSASCAQSFSGSGFVFAPERIMTNAHVVAGTDRLFVRVGGTGRPLSARVVLFDPGRDVAVLAVDGLTSPSLPFAPAAAERGDDAIVVGFPGGDGYTLSSARVRGTVPARGTDIYDVNVVEREVHALRTSVRPGNSGGPLLDPQGQVLGVVFAASTEDPETGYALTAREVASDVSAGARATTSVPTGSCT